MRKVLPAFLALLLAASALMGSGRKETKIVIFYTASLNGNLDGCTCVASPRAGLVTRAPWLRSRPERDSSLLVDAGDLFDTRADDLMPALVLDSYSELGYDAIAVGDQELANGAAALLSLKQGRPLLSNNLSVCPTEDSCIIFSLAPLYAQKSWGKAGICALIDPSVFTLYPETLKKTLKIAACADAARGLLERMRADGALLKVLLYHGPVQNAAALAREAPGFDVIVAGHEQLLAGPERIGDTLLVSPGEEGNRVGRLELVVSGGRLVSYRNEFRLFSYAADAQDPVIRARIEGYWDALTSRLKAHQ
jgi:2',3'-cyclic-nucleotide 2'-phosphodiesterase (5'-nucleotidase family)